MANQSPRRLPFIWTILLALVLWAFLLWPVLLLSGCNTTPLLEVNGCQVDAVDYLIASASADKLAELPTNDVLVYSRADHSGHAAHVWQYRGRTFFRDAKGTRELSGVYDWSPRQIARAAEPGVEIIRAHFLRRSQWQTQEPEYYL
jgi:hypothetical protein